MKKINMLSVLIAFVLVCVAINISGCASLRDKFVRKKKKEATTAHYRSMVDYDIRPSLELYTKHYVYWRSWSKELLELLGENAKKDKRSIREVIGNLEDMRNMLVDVKADELEKHIERLRGVEKDIAKGNITTGTKTRIRLVLEKEAKLIKIDFSYRKMGPFIREEFRRKPSQE